MTRFVLPFAVFFLMSPVRAALPPDTTDERVLEQLKSTYPDQEVYRLQLDPNDASKFIYIVCPLHPGASCNPVVTGGAKT